MTKSCARVSYGSTGLRNSRLFLQSYLRIKLAIFVLLKGYPTILKATFPKHITPIAMQQQQSPLTPSITHTGYLRGMRPNRNCKCRDSSPYNHLCTEPITGALQWFLFL